MGGTRGFTSNKNKECEMKARPIGILLLLSTCALLACGGGGGGGSGGAMPGGDTRNPTFEFTFSAVEAGDHPNQIRFVWVFDGTARAFRFDANPDGASGFSPMDINGDGAANEEDLIDGAAREMSITVPLLQASFIDAAYRVVALNDAGAELDSTGNLTTLHIIVNALVGYFKPPSDTEVTEFGRSIAVSGDGSTLAVGAHTHDGGLVVVFSRDEDGTWIEQAQIRGTDTAINHEFGSSVALSDDGDTLAVGAWGHGENVGDAYFDRGAAYVFGRSGATWEQHAFLTGQNTGNSDRFGWSIALSGDGRMLAVGAPGEDGPADTLPNVGTVYVFTGDGPDSWGERYHIYASNGDGGSAASGEVGDLFGSSVALSGDGSTLAVGAPEEDSIATDDDLENSAKSAGAVYVFHATSTGATERALIKASNAEAGDYFGTSVAVSTDGNSLAIGAPGEDSGAPGINGDQGNAASDTGAVYVFVHEADAWSQETYIKASNPNGSDEFGASVDMSGSGNALLVGSPAEESYATTINPTNFGYGATLSGAAYLFKRNANDEWEQLAHVKAPNSDPGDRFGASVALSGNGNAAFIGAPQEDGGARGLGGDRSSNDSEDSGAVYSY